MNLRKVVAVVAPLAVIVGTGLWLLRPELAEYSSPASVAIATTPELIERGRYLARAGNCVACHTQLGQAEYAGGRAIDTPFGTVYSSNLTPDLETGLGHWDADDFWRAMHFGKSRDGRRLSPAFPYTNYTLVSRADTDAIFAFLKSLPPAHGPRRAAAMRFPFDTQAALLAWRALYFRPAAYVDNPQRDAAWNRGAYLVEGLGHCNACHTVRTALGGLDNTADYAGGPIPMLEWDALPLARNEPLDSAAAADMRSLLKTGATQRGVASGPMAEVVFHSLQHLDEQDIAAMVDYIATLPAHAAPETSAVRVAERDREQLLLAGAPLYREQCASCHGDQGEGKPDRYPALAGNRVVVAASARNAIGIVLNGGYGPSTAANPRPYGMPPFGHQLKDRDIAAVLSYVRQAWGNAAPAVSPVEVQRH